MTSHDMERSEVRSLSQRELDCVGGGLKIPLGGQVDLYWQPSRGSWGIYLSGWGYAFNAGADWKNAGE